MASSPLLPAAVAGMSSPATIKALVENHDIVYWYIYSYTVCLSVYLFYKQQDNYSFIQAKRLKKATQIIGLLLIVAISCSCTCIDGTEF
jgi:hypothetical protein